MFLFKSKSKKNKNKTIQNLASNVNMDNETETETEIEIEIVNENEIETEIVNETAAIEEIMEDASQVYDNTMVHVNCCYSIFKVQQLCNKHCCPKCKKQFDFVIENKNKYEKMFTEIREQILTKIQNISHKDIENISMIVIVGLFSYFISTPECKQYYP